jgi:fructose-specific component phosphotransferase system IIB-like protein
VVAGRYRLLTRLGEGGMGVVWRAHDQLLRRDIAVKELHVRLGVDRDLRTRQVLQEARAAAQLRHPGVVAVHDVVVDEGRPLILMELVEGLSLAQRVRQQGPLTEQRAAEIGVRLLEALSVAHAHGVVHRDVKPANILLNGERVVLTDFGIAAITSDTTVNDAMVGSLDYMAPERINGEQATPASDVWSLGVTLCTALRGESPFQRSHTQATLAAVLTYEPAPIAQAPRLWRVLAMLLHKDPRQRPTAAAAAALLATIAGVQWSPAGPVREPMVLPVQPVVPPVVPPDDGHVVEPLTDSPTGPRRQARRTRRRLAAVLTVLVLLVAGGLWLLVPPADVAGTATSAASAPTLPDGFTAHRGDGFDVAIPKGWFKDPYPQEIFWVSDPHSPDIVLARLEWWDNAKPGGAYRALTDLEKGDLLDEKYIDKYKRISLAKKGAQGGTTRAELEATYHVTEDGGFYLHERIRAFVTKDGRTYIFSVSSQGDTRAAAERLWRTEQDQLTEIMESFRVKP